MGMGVLAVESVSGTDSTSELTSAVNTASSCTAITSTRVDAAPIPCCGTATRPTVVMTLRPAPCRS